MPRIQAVATAVPATCIEQAMAQEAALARLRKGDPLISEYKIKPVPGQ